MFTKEEMTYISNCVEAQRSPNTDVARTKAGIMLKICDALENIEKENQRKAKARAAKKK